MSVDPRGMSLLDWADSVTSVVGDNWDFGRLTDESRWQDWAVGLVRASGFTQRNPPDPYQFGDWREWAMRMYPILEGAVNG